MKVIETGILDCYVIEPQVFGDHRGFFYECFNEDKLIEQGIPKYNWIQDNHSKSQYGVIRGLHYQLAPHAQTKLVRVVSGAVIDNVIDIRENSPTFGKHFSIELSAENKKQLLVPKGFAHGFSVISKQAEFLYKVDYPYIKEAEKGINPVNSGFNIDWGIPNSEALLSDKDKTAPDFDHCERNFIYNQ